MAAFYFDSSALVKYYVHERGSLWVRGIIDQRPPNEIFIALITGAEIVAAITRRARIGLTSANDAAVAIGDFRKHFQLRYRTAAISPPVVHQAMALAENHGLRGYDAVQLAAALTVRTILVSSGIKQLTFISADRNLNQAALAEGLAVDDPNNHP